MTKTEKRARQLASASAFLGGVALLGAMWQPHAEAQTAKKPKKGAKPMTSAASSQPLPSAAPSTAPPASGAASGPIPAPPAELSGDGGVRPSPLNPNAEEMPGFAASGGSVAAPAATVDYDRLLGDIAALRARVADVSDALFVSHIVLSIQTDGDHSTIGHLTIELDDGVVYTAAASFHSPDPATVYEHAVAPGHHAITVDVDRKDDRDDTFRDAQRTRFIVDVPKDQRLAVTLRVGDESDMGKNFPGDHAGKYDLRVRMKAAASGVKR